MVQTQPALDGSLVIAILLLLATAYTIDNVEAMFAMSEFIAIPTMVAVAAIRLPDQFPSPSLPIGSIATPETPILGMVVLLRLVIVSLIIRFPGVSSLVHTSSAFIRLDTLEDRERAVDPHAGTSLNTLGALNSFRMDPCSVSSILVFSTPTTTPVKVTAEAHYSTETLAW